MIDRAIGEYRNQQFSEAEDLLLQADQRWKDTNTEDNEEITVWLAKVRWAMRSTKGWVIERTDPLYAEITQLLKFATVNYKKVGLKTKLKDGDVVSFFSALRGG